MRLILFTGKGGVGKTSASLATAVGCAKAGKKTIVVSTDPAHNLSDALEVKVGSKSTYITNNLYAQEIDVQTEMKDNWDLVKGHLLPFLEEKGMKGIIAEELAILPGLEEVFSLLEIKEHIDNKKYEVIILDSAPTASALRLISFPEIMGWWVKNVLGIMNFNVNSPMMKLLKPLANRFVPGSEESIVSAFTTVKDLYLKMRALKKFLQDPNKASVRIVVNLEKMVIMEAQRSFTYYNLFGVSVDAIIVNKVLPDGLENGYFSKWKNSQAKYFIQVQEAFNPLPILTVKYFPQEMIGLKNIEEYAQVLYGTTYPAKNYYLGHPFSFSKEKNGVPVLSVQLPFVEKGNLQLIPRKDEIIIKLGGYKQSIVLPDSYKGYNIKEATLIKDKLRIQFVDKYERR